MADGYGFMDFAIVSPLFPLQGDYPTIQDAIADGALSIYVKSGVYDTLQTITVPSGTVIYGESVDGVVINFTMDHWNFIIEGFGVRISGLSIRDSTNAMGVFHLNAAQNAIVEKCRIDNSDRAAIFNAATFCQFRDNWIQGCHLESVFIDSLSTDNRVSNNRMTDGQHYGIKVEGAFNKIDGNTVAGHEYDGVLVVSKMNVISNNTLNQNANGIYVAKEGGDDNAIVGNVCVENRGYGININSLENAGNVATTNVCKGNLVADVRYVPGNIVGLNDGQNIV